MQAWHRSGVWQGQPSSHRFTSEMCVLLRQSFQENVCMQRLSSSRQPGPNHKATARTAGLNLPSRWSQADRLDCMVSSLAKDSREDLYENVLHVALAPWHHFMAAIQPYTHHLPPPNTALHPTCNICRHRVHSLLALNTPPCIWGHQLYKYCNTTHPDSVITYKFVVEAAHLILASWQDLPE